jgi:hypothetical protein
MDRLNEVHSDGEAFDPANFGFERLQSIEFHPQLLVEPGPFDEFDAAAVKRGIEDLDPVIQLTRAPKRDAGI